MTMPVAKPGWVGQRVKRAEDPRLITGRGSYTDDVQVPGMLHCAVLRSPHAHARIKHIDTSRAERLPGVVSVMTGKDVLATGVKPLPNVWPFPGLKSIPAYALAPQEVHYVGEPVAAVAAADRATAEDALELIEVAWEPLPAVTDPERAMAKDSPVLHEGWGDNIALKTAFAGGDIAKAFGAPDGVLRERFRSQRYVAVPMETRGNLAHWDAKAGRLTVWSSTQWVSQLQTLLAEQLGLATRQVRVVAQDVGGAFGPKLQIYHEETLTCLLALRTGRPVKWIEDRQEHFLSTAHSRDHILDLEVAYRNDGTLLGVKARVIGDIGAYPGSWGVGPTWLIGFVLPNAYKLTGFQCDVYAVTTNKVPMGGYRGFGVPQAVFALERAIDMIAQRLGMDPADIRARNMPASGEFPFTTITGAVYDSGDYHACLRKALEVADYQGWRRRQAEARAQGRLLGIGVCFYSELGAYSPSAVNGALGIQMGGYETARISLDPVGKVTLYTGITPNGQGHETTFAQLAADRLGLDPPDIKVIYGDTDVTMSPFGTAGSRGGPLGGAAVIRASEKLREKILQLSAHLLEAAPGDLELGGGRATVRGAPGRFVTFVDVGRAARLAHKLPEGMTPDMEFREIFDPANFTTSYACHVVVVEVDRETGQVTIPKYVVAHDCGTVINPTIVEGQIHGGVAQGLGGALLEHIVYDENGQIRTTTFMDYLVPTAADVPHMDVAHLETPAPHIPGGMKGMGEGGTIGAPAAIANAVADALAPLAVKVTETPLSPQRVWQLMRGGTR